MVSDNINKYIDAEKLKKLIDEKWKKLADKNVKVGGGKWDAEISTYLSVLNLIDSLQQEQPEGIGGVVHHALNTHWIVTDKKQLATVLKEFPEGTEVELFIFARKEE